MAAQLKSVDVERKRVADDDSRSDSESDGEGIEIIESRNFSTLDSLPALAMGGTSGTRSSSKREKKTRGRVKIKMEFIEDKLRRYTTFSKRKTGLMKKAYELSTLTGTEVLLLVASETGHVYTFATRKLQPMITSESGKALIQTCLNSPDGPMTSSQQGGQGSNQRMSAEGFEETELTYAGISDYKSENQENGHSTGSTPASNSLNRKSESPATSVAETSVLAIDSNALPNLLSLNSLTPLATTPSGSAEGPISINDIKTPSLSLQGLQLPTPSSFMLTPGALPSVLGGSGTPLQLGTFSQQMHQSQQGTAFKFPEPTPSTQILNLSGGTVSIPTSPPAATSLTSSLMTPTCGGPTTAVLYRTPDGAVYATPATQGTLALSSSTNINNQQQQQQYISLPVHIVPASQSTSSNSVTTASIQPGTQFPTTASLQVLPTNLSAHKPRKK